MSLSEAQRSALRTLLELWPRRTLVLIGASALDVQIGLRWRQTLDLDLALMAEIEDANAELQRLSGWRRHPRLEHRWTCPDGIAVDILPVGTQALIEGQLAWPESGRVMSLVAMDLAFAHHVQLPIDDLHSIRVATVPVLAVQKMAAYLDHPDTRERDLSDLARVLEGYLEDDHVRRFTPQIVRLGLGFEETNAYLLGRDLGCIIGPHHRRLIEEFLLRIESPHSLIGARMAKLGPASWDGDIGVLRRRILALRQGLGAAE